MNNSALYTTQNDLLLNNLMDFYKDTDNLDRMLKIITGESKISLRIVDWFATNYAKKYYTVYTIEETENNVERRFKVYVDYKLKLKAYSKKRFDPFCRWDRISIPYKGDKHIETTIGQLNFFKWALENKVADYIESNYDTIEKDMNSRNSTSKRKETVDNTNTRNSQSIRKINFEDIQTVIKNPENYLLINTLTDADQICLIQNTIIISQEELIINKHLRNGKNIRIIVYGKNCNDEKIYKKYQQLLSLGFYNVFIYTGGLFVWLLLQDIYGSVEFPTATQLVDVLKYKPASALNIFLLEND